MKSTVKEIKMGQFCKYIILNLNYADAIFLKSVMQEYRKTKMYADDRAHARADVFVNTVHDMLIEFEKTTQESKQFLIAGDG